MTPDYLEIEIIRISHALQALLSPSSAAVKVYGLDRGEAAHDLLFVADRALRAALTQCEKLHREDRQKTE